MFQENRKLFLLFFAATFYFSILLIPKVYPAFGGTVIFFLYFLSLLFLLPLVLGCTALWGLIGIGIAIVKKVGISKKHSVAVLFASFGICAFILVIFFSSYIPSRLPTGSDMMNFDSKAWQSPESSAYKENDITIRQKMLKNVVDILSGKTQDEIEQLLGPSLDTPYFKSNGRDLIYVLGPERDALFGIDSEWLCIWLDDDGKFQKYRITVD